MHQARRLLLNNIRRCLVLICTNHYQQPTIVNYLYLLSLTPVRGINSLNQVAGGDLLHIGVYPKAGGAKRIYPPSAILGRYCSASARWLGAIS